MSHAHVTLALVPAAQASGAAAQAVETTVKAGGAAPDDKKAAGIDNTLQIYVPNLLHFLEIARERIAGIEYDNKSVPQTDNLFCISIQDIAALFVIATHNERLSIIEKLRALLNVDSCRVANHIKEVLIALLAYFPQNEIKKDIISNFFSDIIRAITSDLSFDDPKILNLIIQLLPYFEDAQKRELISHIKLYGKKDSAEIINLLALLFENLSPKSSNVPDAKALSVMAHTVAPAATAPDEKIRFRLFVPTRGGTRFLTEQAANQLSQEEHDCISTAVFFNQANRRDAFFKHLRGLPKEVISLTIAYENYQYSPPNNPRLRLVGS